MILQRKSLIDFRNWLLSEYELRWHEFDDMPDCGKMGYYVEFLIPEQIKADVIYIERLGEQYNERHEQDK